LRRAGGCGGGPWAGSGHGRAAATGGQAGRQRARRPGPPPGAGLGGRGAGRGGGPGAGRGAGGRAGLACRGTRRMMSMVSARCIRNRMYMRVSTCTGAAREAVLESGGCGGQEPCADARQPVRAWGAAGSRLAHAPCAGGPLLHLVKPPSARRRPTCSSWSAWCSLKLMRTELMDGSIRQRSPSLRARATGGSSSSGLSPASISGRL
jgi:hypothetical protein